MYNHNPYQPPMANVLKKTPAPKTNKLVNLINEHWRAITTGSQAGIVTLGEILKQGSPLIQDTDPTASEFFYSIGTVAQTGAAIGLVGMGIAAAYSHFKK